MQTKLFLITFAIVITFLGFNQKVEAQKSKHFKPLASSRIPIVENRGGCDTCLPCLMCPQIIDHDSSGNVPIYCNTATGADAPYCDSLAASGNVGVKFTALSTVLGFGNKIYINGAQFFTNNSPCDENFVTCSMVEYAAPEMDQNHFDSTYFPNPASPGDSVLDTASDPFGETVNCWQDSEVTCDTCSTHCNYVCFPIGTEFIENWSYYFGCQEVSLAPGQSMAINTGWHAVDAPILTTHRDPLDTATKPITLSPNPANIKDSSISTWNYNGLYMDFLKGCQFLSGNGCDFGDEPGQMVSEEPYNYTCTIPQWVGIDRIEIAYHGRSNPTGIVSFPVGNQATSTMADTMNAHTVYQAEFIGSLVGAPAGSELMIYAPEDTFGNRAVIDSGWVWTDTVGDCLSDTLEFAFPFVIPPPTYLDRGMTFIVYFPSDSCSNVGNGKRIYLTGQVMANATTPLYDSGAFMYNAQGTMIMDTTSPAITSFITVPVDSTHLAISLTGVDDTTMVPFGYVVYTIDGGPQQLMPLRFANSLAVGDTTIFKDTLVSPVSHPVINIKGFVQNQVGLLDSSIMIILPLDAPLQGVTAQSEDSLRVNYMMIDHSSKTLTLDVQADGAPIELDLVTEDGRPTKLTSETSSPSGEQKFVQSLSNFASGAYFLVVKSGNNSIVENIIL